MRSPIGSWRLCVGVVAGLLSLAGCGGCRDTYEVTHTDVTPPPEKPNDPLADDVFDPAKAPAFDPALVDSRPIKPDGPPQKNAADWLVNSSAAVIGLDVPIVRPDYEGHLLQLHPSYAAAAKAGKTHGTVLPSINIIDGKAKQFDDGLYAALDQAYYSGLEGKLRSHVDLVRKLFDKVGPDSSAAPFLAAGLELAGVSVEPKDAAAKARWLSQFNADEIASKPLGFYTWNKTLSACFRFLRFFQHEFDEHDLVIPSAIAAAMKGDAALRAGFANAEAFYAKLTNPSICMSIVDLAAIPNLTPAAFRNLDRRAVSLFPSSSSRETRLFERLFPEGLPPNADLMGELIRAVRSGKVKLFPRSDAGWYDHQVYALETLLLPERGEERDKLLLTKRYKKRMLDAFAAMITTRRETHVRELGIVTAKAARPFDAGIAPRLRVEPCPTYYLRTARAYAFLSNVLEAAVGADGLKSLHGLTADGERKPDLHAELASMRSLFYGLYLLSCEDIGKKPALAADEGVDIDACRKAAEAWLATGLDDADLAADVRVSVPVFADRVNSKTRLWTVLGVRLAKLDARYQVAPRVRDAAAADAPWKEVESWRVSPSHYLIPVAEFAEIELTGLRVLNRDEFRAACDRGKTREGIVRELTGSK